MQLAISFSELELQPRILRALDLEFSDYEETARTLPPARDRSRIELERSNGELVHADLHRELPSLELFEPGDDPETRRRVWRPPYGLLPDADRRWLERWNLSDGRRSLPVPARFDAGHGWNDPTRRDVRRLCAALREITAHIDEEVDRVA